jgi:hypothetical protein
MALNLIPPPLTQLHCTWALVHVREYVYVMHASAFNILMAPSVETITALRHFHPKTNLILDRKANIYVLMCSPCLSSISLLGMVYEILWDFFILDDSIDGFDF